MKCSVGSCSRAATYRVMFTATQATYCYCSWHTLGRDGEQRWPIGVATVEKI